ncbi:MAG TPA: twin-arginine translocase TatA/TatE family subunit [Thermoanaerobaculia bacterium]|nr:twin-arginine translocase TatA/TatE family subunit [Thermoanaerobaculia bacterium]
MGNLGMPELILILALALLLFGPQKLPEIGKQVGKALGEFKRTSNELKRTIEDEMDRATKDAPSGEPPPPGTAPASEPPQSAPESGPVKPS